MAHELIDRKYLYRGKVLDLSLSRFQSATKGEVVIEVVHHNGGAAAIPLFEDGTTALVKQFRYPLGRYSLEIAAGRIEPGDSPEQTALRELEEELALKASKLQKLSEFYVAPGYCEERLHVYLATGLEQSAQNLDADEEIDIVKLPFDEALALVRSGQIDDSKSIIGLLTAAEMLGK